MKPVAVFRHSPTEGPGYFATYLESRDLPWRLVALDQDEAVPSRPEDFSGLVFMGGPMSVNDDLPWIAPVLELIRKAVAADVPVLGHCLGGQLMAKALGGSVGRNPVKEIGWGEIEVADNSQARAWFGPDLTRFESFHWHGETFTIPPSGVGILDSVCCANQAFVLDNRHLGMQCHIEMTPDMIHTWCETGADEIAASPGPSVQTAVAMQADLDTHIPRLREIADKLYSRWIQGLEQ